MSTCTRTGSEIIDYVEAINLLNRDICPELSLRIVNKWSGDCPVSGKVYVRDINSSKLTITEGGTVKFN